MIFNKRQRILLLLSTPLLFSACSDDVITDSKDDSVKEPAEIITPVDFRYLTLNYEGNCGEKPSISYIHNNTTVYFDFFNQVNGSQILPNPNDIIQIKDKLIIAYGSNWNDNGLIQVDANTFKKESELNIGADMIPYAIESLGGDSVFVAGRCKTELNNAFIARVSDDLLLKRKMEINFTIRKMKRVGNKLFALGIKDNRNGEALVPNILVADITSMHKNGFRVIAENYPLSSRYSDLCVDYKGNLWFAADKDGYKLFCIDTNAEKILHTVAMPYSMSVNNELAYAISNDGKTVYLRNHKAFYAINVNDPQTPDEPVFEYIKHTGVINDLKISKEGHLLFVDQNISCKSQSTVVEIQNIQDEWSVLSETTVGMVAKSIYIAKYEK